MEEITPGEVVAMVPRGAAPDLEDAFVHQVVRYVQFKILQVMETVAKFAQRVLKDVVDDHQRGLEAWDEECAHPAIIFKPSQCRCGWRSEYVIGVFIEELPSVPAQTRT